MGDEARRLDRLTALAARLLEAPIALVAVADGDHLRFVSRRGISIDHAPRDGWCCAEAMEGDVPLVVADVSADLRFARHQLAAGPPQLRAYAGAALRTPRGEVLGTLWVADLAPRHWPPPQLALLTDLAHLAADALELGQLERGHAFVDPLTGLASRRAFHEMIPRELARADRPGGPALSFAMFDVDHLPAILHTHGRDTADRALVAVADAVGRTIRGADLAVRYGNGELLLVAPDCDLAGAIAQAERVRLAVAGTTIDRIGTMTVSAGVAERVPQEPLADALRRAEEALEAARQHGRNQVRP